MEIAMTPPVKRLTMTGFVLVMVLLLPGTHAVAGSVAGTGNTWSDSSAVVRTWESISMRTIFTENAPGPVGVLYLGFTSLAMYRAAQATNHRHGAAEAAVATAAHGVLVEYLPESTGQLDADLATSLAAVPDGWAKRQGQEAGAQIAARLIAGRVDDGRGDTSIVYQKDPAPGVWQPDPGGAMLAPWLGFVRPLILRGPIRAPGVNGPDALTSAAYTADFDEVKRLGSATSSERTQEQTDTARFFNAGAAIMVSVGLLDYLENRPLGLADTARLFAVMHTAMSDALITCWGLKYDVGFWRPFQAIRAADTDGNPATAPDPSWTPLIANPPYSDYVSGHGCLTAPAVQAIRRTLGERTPLTLYSNVTNTNRTYSTLDEIEQDAFHARIWGGLHFRTAMDDAYAIGHTAADQILRRLR
jgi:hypothetical protein